jgi:hypothetical protein
MKTQKIAKSVVLGMALLMAVSAFAANKGTLQITAPVTLNGKSLAAGEYSLQWDGTGNTVQLNVMQGKKVVASTPAQLVNLAQSQNNDAAIIKANADGSRTLSEIRFGGKKYALAIATDSPQSDSSTSTK